MKISINDKKKINNTLKSLHSKNFLIISSNYTVEYLYKILKGNQRIINNKDENNETFLSYAIKRRNTGIIDLLLTSPLLDYSYQNINGNSYLHLSVIYELESSIKTLIQKGIDINLKNIDGNTALHYAYSVNNYRIIIILLQNKIDFTIKNNQGLIAEEIKPNSLKIDDLIINNNNKINKSIIIDWENNKINNENNIKENKIKSKYIYKSKNNTPLLFKKAIKIFKNNNNDVNEYNYFYKIDKKIKGKSQDINKFPFTSVKSEKNINIFDYNNTEKAKKSRFYINNLIDSKEETVRKNIFESRVLPSNHKINCHICDLNYLNNYRNDNLDNNKYKKISKSHYFIRGLKPINNFSLIKLSNRYDLSEDSKLDSDRMNLNSARIKSKENSDFFGEEITSFLESNDRKRKSSHNLENNNKNNNDPINQKSTNDSYIQNNLSLYHFLSKIKMEKYFNRLLNNGFDDVNLLISQTKTENPITDKQLKEIGIDLIGDRARILVRLEENSNNFGSALPNEVYYICENLCDIDINEDANVNKLFKWLNKINVEEYLDNFLINGYYSIELLFVQMISKNPLNDDILKEEIEINKIGHRSRILNKLIEDSKEFQKKLKRKGFLITSGKETKSCDCILF